MDGGAQAVSGVGGEQRERFAVQRLDGAEVALVEGEQARRAVARGKHDVGHAQSSSRS